MTTRNNIAELKHFPHDSKPWQAWFNGVKVCQSLRREWVITQIREGKSPKAKRYSVVDVGESSTAVSAAKSVAIPTTKIIPVLNTDHPLHVMSLPPKPEFTVQERFQFLSDYADMIINRDIVSLMVSGSAGCGKTHMINSRLAAAGLQLTVVEETFINNGGSSDSENSGDDDDNDGLSNVEQEPSSDQCVLVKGYSTAKFLYKTLYHCRNGLVIFDDADKIIEDKTAINILKAALDSYDKRVVTWGAAGMIDDGLPRSFEFKGGVIVITNKQLRTIDKANRSRAALMDITLNADEFIDLIEEKMGTMCLDLAIAQRREVLEFIKEHKDDSGDLNLRTFQLLCKIRKSNPGNWKRMAAFTLTLV